MNCTALATAVLILAACTPKSETAAPDAPPAAAPQVAKPAAPPPPPAPQKPAQPAVASVQPLQGSKVTGTLTFTPTPDGVKIEGEISNLPANSTHGFHVHEKGDCSAPDGASAGPHFNPAQHEHGDLDSPFSHIGDLGNIKSDATGVAHISLVKKQASLEDGAYYSYIGRSIIVHKQADDLKSQPAGASGDKIACGVIKPKI